MVVYVKQFKGYAFSHQVWEREYENLKRTLSNENFDQNIWYQVGYNSPFTAANERTNEIWIPKV